MPNQPFAAICNKDNHLRRFERALPGVQHQLVERILARAEHAARVGQFEMRPLPFGGKGDDIASRAGDRRDDRPPCAGQAVEERGFSDIRTSDEHDRREVLHGMLTA